MYDQIDNLINKKFNAFEIDVQYLYKKKIQISLVIGGGNIFRGTDAVSVGIERTTADYMGMLGTVINSLAIQNALEKKKIQTELSENFKSSLNIDYEHDPDLIAGLVVQVGSIMIDTSVKTKLKKLEKNMVEA